MLTVRNLVSKLKIVKFLSFQKLRSALPPPVCLYVKGKKKKQHKRCDYLTIKCKICVHISREKKWLSFYKASGAPTFTKKSVNTQTPDTICGFLSLTIHCENKLCGHGTIGQVCDNYKLFFGCFFFK